MTSNAANCEEEAEVRLGASTKKAMRAKAVLRASQFSHFLLFFTTAASTVGLSGFPLSCPLRSSLFHASLRRAARPRWCSLTHGFRLRLKKGTTWLSLCVGINHQRRTVRVELDFPVHST